MPRAMHSAKMPGKRCSNSAPSMVASRKTAGRLLLAEHLAGHDVARRELGELVAPDHESLAARR